MFRVLFGLSVAPAGSSVRPPERPILANLALQLLADVDPHFPDYTELLAREVGWEDTKSLYAAIKLMPQWGQSERSELLAAIVDAGHLQHLSNLKPTSADHFIAQRFKTITECLFRNCLEFDQTPATFRALARLFGDTTIWSPKYNAYQWQRHMKPFAKLGYVPDGDERKWLEAFKAKLSMPSNRYDLKAEIRLMESAVRWIDKLCDFETDVAERLARLTTRSREDGRFSTEPANFDFWIDVIIGGAKHLEQLCAELKRCPNPDWLHDAEAYARRFPCVEGISRPFGWWTDHYSNLGARATEPLPGISWAERSGSEPATAADYHDCLIAPVELWTLNLVWSTAAVPRIDVLADIDDAAQVALLLHLAEAKPGFAPQKKWLADACRLVDAVGRDRALTQIRGWLELFASAAPTRENHARYHNYRVLVRAAAVLQARCPTLPRSGDRVLADRAAASLSIQAGGSYLDEGYLFCSKDSRWLGNVQNRGLWEDDGLSIRGIETWKPSHSNEALLRGVIWLCGAMPDRDTVDRLERTVASAVAYSNGSGLRSRGTANAAIAALAGIGSPAAREALARIRRTVPDKAVANSVAKAIAALAKKQGVDAADVEEMAVPDYGFG